VTALAGAGDIEPPAPPRRRRLARGMAAAGALSLAVHAAVLLGRVPAGSAASTAAPLAPVLQTRLVATPAPAVPSPEEPAPVAAPPPVQVAPAPSTEPPKVIPTIDREAATSSLPVPPPLPVQAPPPMVATKPLPAPSVAPPIAIADASPIAAPPAPAVTYQGSMGLDPPPRPLADIDPVIPEAAGSRGGVVVLRLYINEHGTVDKAEMVRSTPPGLFDASMLEAATQVRFAPGYLAGVAVKSQVTMEIKIRGLGSGAEAGGRTY
jgi:TonB family protein